jgi:hypothetical protein
MSLETELSRRHSSCSCRAFEHVECTHTRPNHHRYPPSHGIPSGRSPIASFCSICFLNSASRLASSTYRILSLLAFSFNSPKGSNRSLSGFLKGFCCQLPRSVSVVLLGRLFSTSYALLRGGSANGFGVGGTRVERSVETVSGREYGPGPNSVLLRSVDRVK